MSVSVYLNSDFDGLSFTAEGDGAGQDSQTIWVQSRSRYATISITMSKQDRAKLRAALDEADAIAELERTK